MAQLWSCTWQPEKGRPWELRFTSKFGGFRCMAIIRRFFNEEDGQDVVEYGLLIATIAIVVLIGVGIFGNNINSWFVHLAGRITTTGT